MKKFLLGVLVLGAVLFANSVSAATASYWTLFDSQNDIDSNWQVSWGGWALIDNPSSEIGSDLIYGATPLADPQASSWVKRPGFYNLATTGLTMNTVFGTPGEQSATGLYFGADYDDNHAAYLYRDSNNHLFMCVNAYSKTTNTDYSFDLGTISSEDDVYWLSIGVDETNDLDWWVGIKNTSGGYDQVNSGEDVLTLPVLTGVVGLFTQAENGFGYFNVSYETVPVPGSVILLGMGLVGLVGFKRRQK